MMTEDLTDREYGRLTVIGRAPDRMYSGRAFPMWFCRCRCGTEKAFLANNLKRELSQSCGCSWHEQKPMFAPEQDAELARRYESGESTVTLAKEFCCTVMPIINAIERAGGTIFKPNERPQEWYAESHLEHRVFKDEARREMARLYVEDKETTHSIADLFETDHGMVCKVLESLGIPRRSNSEAHRVYTLDEHAFDQPLSRDGAYYTGLLLADGCLMKRDDSWATAISLAGDDGLHLNDLRAFLKTDAPLKPTCPDSSSFANSQPGWRLCVASKMIGDALVRLGFTERKSLTAHVHRSLRNNVDLWRGMICGDGWVTTIQRGERLYPVIGLTGSLATIEQFSAFMRKNTGAKATVGRNHSVWKVQTSGRYAYKLIKLLFGEGRVALPRKQAIATNILHLLDNEGNQIGLAHNNRFTWVTKTIIREAFRLCKTWKATARHLGMSAWTLREIRERFSISIVDQQAATRGLTPEILAAAIETASSLAEAAEALGLNYSTFWRLRRQHGI